MARATEPANRADVSGPLAGPLRRHGQWPGLPAHRHRPPRLRGRHRARHGLLGPGPPRDSWPKWPSAATWSRPIASKAARSPTEMQTLRFGLKPSAVYFNPTERCNLNCTYCYIPGEDAPQGAAHVPREAAGGAWRSSKLTSARTVPKGSLPQIVFHGAEPLLEPRGRLRRHRAVCRRFPLRRADQRHAAGRLGHRLPPRARREHRHFARCAHAPRSPTARGAPGKAGASSTRSSRPWTGSRAIRAGA